MIKNPTNPDLKLWIGALERMMNGGIEDLYAIHRGFSVYEKNLYRNNPNWQIALDLKKELPNIPLLCDPSHIWSATFNSQYIPESNGSRLRWSHD